MWQKQSGGLAWYKPCFLPHVSEFNPPKFWQIKQVWIFFKGRETQAALRYPSLATSCVSFGWLCHKDHCYRTGVFCTVTFKSTTCGWHLHALSLYCHASHWDHLSMFLARYKTPLESWEMLKQEKEQYLLFIFSLAKSRVINYPAKTLLKDGNWWNITYCW